MNKELEKIRLDLQDDLIRRNHYYEVIKKHANQARKHITEMEKLAKNLAELNSVIIKED